ncbi:MAG: hypothetical protein MUC85_04110 [Anaerolineales bacterium]|jgi:hypothetical protein|nr:hypothetical protein [Anaerolineales bacterium]
MTNNISILVSSFDRYAACWAPFCHGLQKYWPEHFQPLYFITNEKDPPCGQAIKVGQDRGWAGNLLYALEQIDSPYILYAQEDYWLTAPVNSTAISEYTALFDSGVADYIRLYPAPPPALPFPSDERLGILETHAEYRTSLQMALWRKSVLQALLVPGETPWQFEVQGSLRSQVYGERFLSVTKKTFGINYLFTAIVDGEWSKAAYTYAQNENITVNFLDLPHKPFLRKFGSRVRNLLYGYRRKIRKVFSCL